jgi:hypothetical protein
LTVFRCGMGDLPAVAPGRRLGLAHVREVSPDHGRDARATSGQSAVSDVAWASCPCPATSCGHMSQPTTARFDSEPITVNLESGIPNRFSHGYCACLACRRS